VHLTQPFEILGQQLVLLPEKAVYWKNRKALLISDIHFGKVAHFRKAGIAVPAAIAQVNLQTLTTIVKKFVIEELIILGDFSHSSFNAELTLFAEWKSLLGNRRIILVKGNHDILSLHSYSEMDIEVVNGCLEYHPFIFSHEPLTDNKTGLYNIAGHIHPAVQLVGQAKQSLTLPCFYFGATSALLPAFGGFTGSARIKAFSEDDIFVIADSKVFKVA
jgi:uncharacterized protein